MSLLLLSFIDFNTLINVKLSGKKYIIIGENVCFYITEKVVQRNISRRKSEENTFISVRKFGKQQF